MNLLSRGLETTVSAVPRGTRQLGMAGVGEPTSGGRARILGGKLPTVGTSMWFEETPFPYSPRPSSEGCGTHGDIQDFGFDSRFLHLVHGHIAKAYT